MKQVKMKVNQIFEVIESAENVKINRKLDVENSDMKCK